MLDFECPEPQERRQKWASLISGPDTGLMLVWQRDLVGAAKFINESLHKVYISAAGPSYDGQASDQPGVAGRDVIL